MLKFAENLFLWFDLTFYLNLLTTFFYIWLCILWLLEFRCPCDVVIRQVNTKQLTSIFDPRVEYTLPTYRSISII